MGIFSKGDKVEVTKWGGGHTGTVVGSSKKSVFVQYDKSIVEDELDPKDVKKR